MFRDDPKSFAQDALALEHSLQAVENKYHDNLEGFERHFILMPFMHSEDINMQELSVKLINNDHAKSHHECIKTFGRFPHRNKILGRTSTPEEQVWLDNGGGW
eukprot:UN05986